MKKLNKKGEFAVVPIVLLVGFLGYAGWFVATDQPRVSSIERNSSSEVVLNLRDKKENKSQLTTNFASVRP